MSFEVPRRAGLRAAPADRQARLRPPEAPQRRARLLLWLAGAGIGSSLAVIVAVSLARGSWMGPPLTMPGIGPPFELSSWHLSVVTVTIALWITALTGGIGTAAGLLAVRRGARPPARLLLIAAAVVIAVLTVLPPVGSTDSLDYMAFGRMVVLGHSPYVMVPWDLIHLHDAVAKSIPWEWGRNTTPYGPAATVEQFLAARLGGTSAARIVFWLKLANAVAFGTVAVVADRLLRGDPAARLRAHLLWTINPLLIWQLIAAAHLDVLAAAAGMLGLLVAGGWPGSQLSARPAGQPAGQPQLGRMLAAGMLIGLAADVKITFILFGLGLAWAMRRSAVSCLAAACGMLAVLLPSYAWFGPPAIRAVLTRDDRTTADNFYQLISHAQHGFLMEHVGAIAAVLVAAVAIVAISHLPGKTTVQPVIFSALALSTAWLFVWQYQLPSYEAMIVCLLILVPACWLDWLVIARLTAATVALEPGNPNPERSRLLATIAHSNFTLAVPLVLAGATAALVGLCLRERRRSRRETRSPQLS
ncbi:MAG TPA: hypothetical protein VMR00_13295 [Streptosporangiaceae bacterium]|nr:hypothetical protein [Streptosporangiaceae bacterium]